MSSADKLSSSRGRRRWLFRFGAMGLGVLLLLAVEGICRLAGWGRNPGFVDPGFDPGRSLFVTNTTGDQFTIRETRLKFFAPQSFPVSKGEDTFRVFCLGGSTVQGRPYSTETAFSSWLELSLKAAAPERGWEVINCGGVSYASYRLTLILQECLAYEPDLILLCTGHNEFLEERTYQTQKEAPRLLVRGNEQLMKLRTYNLFRRGLLGLTGAPTSPPGGPGGEVDALLDYRNGLKAYHRDDAWRAEVVTRFEANVDSMIGIAGSAGVPIVVLKPPSNLSDSPPFKSQHRDNLSEQDLLAFDGLVAKAKRLYGTEPRRAIELLQQALKLDDVYAETHFELGEVYEALGMREPARAAFLQARELDICPLRILSEMEERLVRLTQRRGTELLDLQELIHGRSGDGIVGSEWLVDHVHPSIRGHQLISEHLVAVMAERGWVSFEDGWEARRDQLYKEWFATLGELYYLRGQQRLENLRAWTKGEADGPVFKGPDPTDQ